MSTYNQGDRVDVVDDVVGDSVELHDGSLRSQVTGHLVVSEPVDGVEQEAINLMGMSDCIVVFAGSSTYTLQAEMARLTSSTHSSS
jgi:hypothetical protein